MTILLDLENARHRLGMCIKAVRGDYIGTCVDEILSTEDLHERSRKISEMKSVICACR